MRVVVRPVDAKDAPPEIAAFATSGQVFLTPGHEYEVYALSVFEGHVMIQVVDDLHNPDWYPQWFFEMVDPTPAPDWIINFFNGEPRLLIGPDLVARDIQSYEQMATSDARAIRRFRERLRSLNAKHDET